MAQVEGVEALNLEYQKNEELFEDKDAEVLIRYCLMDLLMLSNKS